MQSEILKPLGMQDTFFSVTPKIESRIARGYFLGDPNSASSIVQNSERDFGLPAGGLLSTLRDLAKLMCFQLGSGPETVLTRKTLESSFTGIVPSDGDLRYGDGVGFAAVRNADSRLTALGHGGLRRAGFVASYEFDRSTRTGVLLTQIPLMLAPLPSRGIPCRSCANSSAVTSRASTATPRSLRKSDTPLPACRVYFLHSSARSSILNERFIAKLSNRPPVRATYGSMSA
jgi:Beta-lactamase